MNKKWMLFFILIFVFCPLKGYAKRDLSHLNFLHGVDAFSSEKELRIVLNLRDAAGEVSRPYLYKKSIQLDIPETFINPSKRSFPVNDRLIKTIMAVQFSKDVIRLRLMFGEQRIESIKKLKMTKKGNQIILSVFRPSAVTDNNLSSTPSVLPVAAPPVLEDKVDARILSLKEALNSNSKTLSTENDPLPMKVEKEVEAKIDEEGKTSIDKDIELLSDPRIQETHQEILEENPVKSSEGEEVGDIYFASVKMVASLFVILAVIFFGVYILKKFYLKGESFLGQGKIIKVLSTSYIGGKNSIALVDVAGEVLVLGVSPSGISMLAKMDSNKKIDQLKNGKKPEKTEKPRKEKPKTLFDKYLEDASPIEGGTQNQAAPTQNKNETIVRVAEMIKEKRGETVHVKLNA